jgi:hypothetical protein
MANSSLVSAKNAKNDEFYTQWADIEKEIRAYLDFNPDVFRGKVILCPCDDPEWSNFTKFFALHFKEFGIKKFISTSYAAESKKYQSGYQPTLFETGNPKFDRKKTFNAGNAFFATPFAENYGEGVFYADTGLVKFRNCCWLTNLDHGRRHHPLPLMTANDNLKFGKHKELVGKEFYDKYDNYDAIEVPYTDAIPSDYGGVMGVPVSFMDKYCPEQFEILGTNDNGLIDDKYKKTKGLTSEFVADYYKDGGTGAYNEGNPTAGYYENGVAKMAYKRIFIKHKKGARK